MFKTFSSYKSKYFCSMLRVTYKSTKIKATDLHISKISNCEHEQITKRFDINITETFNIWSSTEFNSTYFYLVQQNTHIVINIDQK